MLAKPMMCTSASDQKRSAGSAAGNEADAIGTTPGFRSGDRRLRHAGDAAGSFGLQLIHEPIRMGAGPMRRGREVRVACQSEPGTTWHIAACGARAKCVQLMRMRESACSAATMTVVDCAAERVILTRRWQ